MRRFFRFPACLAGFIGCLISSSALAQSQGTNVAFRVLCLDRNKDVMSAFAPAAGGKEGKIEVPFYTNDFSETLEATFGGDKMVFFTEAAGPDGKPLRKVIAEGPLLKAPRQALILIPALPAEAFAYRIIPFDDTGDAFPMGSTRLVNLAPTPVRLSIGGTDLPAVKANGNQIYPQVKNTDDWNMYNARVDYMVKETWVPVSSQSWKANTLKRDWVITSFDVTSQQPMIRLYRDIPPWKREVIPMPAKTP